MHFHNFGKRFCAYVFDMFLLTVVFFILGKAAEDIMSPFTRAVVFYAATILYFAIQESGEMQATLGKRVLGLVVCSKDGERISFTRAVVRNVARLVNIPLLCLGYVTILFTKNEQGLHDFIAGTVVLDS